MKKLIPILTLMFLAGCATTLNVVKVDQKTQTIDCTNVQKWWAGQRGDDPTKLTSLWQCYDWEMKAQ